MRLEKAVIKRFRSIEKLELPYCGSFNVLIGKNNSGKSNVLSAINAFFTCLQDRDVVILEPPLGKEIDFCKTASGEMTGSIDVALSFSLDMAERNSLIQDVVAEAAQMKHALEGLDPSLRLKAVLQFLNRPSRFAFVSRLALVNESEKNGSTTEAERVVLEISRETALEIAARLTKLRSIQRTTETLRSIPANLDDDDLRRLQKEGTPFYRYYMGRAQPLEPTPEADSALRAIFAQSKSPADFHRLLQGYIGNEEANAEKLREEPLRSKVHTFSGDESAVPKYALKLLGRLSQLKVHYLTERRKEIGKDEAQRLLGLKVSRGGPQVLQNIQETVSALLGVKIDAFQSAPVSRTGERIAELDVDDFLVEVNGSGIREALRLVLDVEFEHPNIVLAEEPEMHLHPALEATMMRYLKHISKSCQVFITTHSTNFLDTAEMKNVYLVSKPDSTRVQLMDLEEGEAQIPKELGIRLSSLFMYDRLVFVEAPSDESILREWSSKIGINPSQVNVGFVTMGGARALNYFATESTLNFLTKRQVKLWFLVDRDEKDVSDVDKLETALGDRAVIKVLNRREIENYLICPRAIVEFIKLKREIGGIRKNGESPGESDIKRRIDECAEKLKAFAIRKRIFKEICRPIYPSFKSTADSPNKDQIVSDITAELDGHLTELREKIARVHETYEHESASVDANWGTEKLNIVPGDLLLDMVCQSYGVRFKKERDGPRLAALMNPAEIDQEIINIIKDIGT